MAISPSVSPITNLSSAAHGKKENAIVFVVLVFLIVLLVVYFGFKSKPSTEQAGMTIETPAIKETAFSFKSGRLEVSFMKSDKFGELKIYGEIPVKAGEKGKADPFVIL